MPAPHPRMHGLTHVPGGSDPIPSIAIDAIRFEINNEGLWLMIETTGTVDGLPTGFGINLIADVGDLGLNSVTRDIPLIAGRDIPITVARDFTVTADRDVTFRAERDVVFRAAVGGAAGVDGNVLMAGLPTTDPLISGALWNDGGTLKVS